MDVSLTPFGEIKMFSETLKVAVGSLVVFVLGFISGCGTVHGLCKDGRTAFTIAERVTRPLSEKQTELDSKMAEDNLHHQSNRAQREVEEAHQRVARFLERDPVHPVVSTEPK